MMWQIQTTTLLISLLLFISTTYQTRLTCDNHKITVNEVIPNTKITTSQPLAILHSRHRIESLVTIIIPLPPILSPPKGISLLHSMTITKIIQEFPNLLPSLSYHHFSSFISEQKMERFGNLLMKATLGQKNPYPKKCIPLILIFNLQLNSLNHLLI